MNCQEIDFLCQRFGNVHYPIPLVLTNSFGFSRFAALINSIYLLTHQPFAIRPVFISAMAVFIGYFKQHICKLFPVIQLTTFSNALIISFYPWRGKMSMLSLIETGENHHGMIRIACMNHFFYSAKICFEVIRQH